MIVNQIFAEVESTEHANTLFRTNSAATKCMTSYARATALPFCWSAVGRHIVALSLAGSEDESGPSEEPGYLMDGAGLEVRPVCCDAIDDKL